MKDNAAKLGTAPELRVHGKQEGASFQIIVLGPSGGPCEDNITGLLVRAPQSEWRKGSLIAVDAGAHLAAIIHLLKMEMPMTSEKIPEPGYSQTLKNGPFAGIKFPHISAKANGLYVFRDLLHSVLITHPHLDHLSALAINTPALEYGREAKAIVALPSTIDAIKGHIFNDSIWPNLSDEGHGVGFVTYRRLIEGGNPRLGHGEARGYINVCDGLATKCWGVSHGKCHRRNHSTSHQRGESFGWASSDYNFPPRRMSRISDHGYFSAITEQQVHNAGAYAPAAGASMPSGVTTPGAHAGSQPPSALESNHLFEPVSSSAFFIRNDMTGQEVLIFGDIEPDSVSLFPRNHVVWEDAAHKIAQGTLKAIFVECSYDDSVRDADLYGHLCPRHLIAELSYLTRCVINAKQHLTANTNGDGKPGDIQNLDLGMAMKEPPTQLEMKRKRKRNLAGDLTTTPELEPTDFSTPPSPHMLHGYVGTRSSSQTRRKTSHSHIEGLPTPSARARSVQFQEPSNLMDTAAFKPPSSLLTHAPPSQIQRFPAKEKEKFNEPLKGLNVHIIHVKDTLMDGPAPGDVILKQLQALSAEVGLGVDFDVTSYGESVWV